MLGDKGNAATEAMIAARAVMEESFMVIDLKVGYSGVFDIEVER